MPFCTACGRQNPDDARFCAQCGTRLVSLDDQGTAGSTQGDSTMTFRAPAKAADHEERGLDPEDAAAVDALPAGRALLVVQRGPSAGVSRTRSSG